MEEPTPRLDRDRCLDVGVRIVVVHPEIFEREVEERLGRPNDIQRGQFPCFARKLPAHLLEVVLVDVRVTARPNELTHLQTANCRHHVRQQRVAGDVERHTEEHIRATLVQLARQFPVGHVELEQCVTRLQRHLGQLRDVPG